MTPTPNEVGRGIPPSELRKRAVSLESRDRREGQSIVRKAFEKIRNVHGEEGTKRVILYGFVVELRNEGNEGNKEEGGFLVIHPLFACLVGPNGTLVAVGGSDLSDSYLAEKAEREERRAVRIDWGGEAGMVEYPFWEGNLPRRPERIFVPLSVSGKMDEISRGWEELREVIMRMLGFFYYGDADKAILRGLKNAAGIQ